MILELNLSTLASFLVPGGKKNKVAYHLMGASPLNKSVDPKRFLNAKRSLDGQLKGVRNLTDYSWQNLFQLNATNFGEDTTKSYEAWDNVQKVLSRLEDSADLEGNIGQYPLGIIGFISAEILPGNEVFRWLKPTLDNEINLTVAFQKATQKSNKIEALSQSDMAKTSTGNALIQAYTSSNSETSKAIYASGLCVLTWFQILSTVWLGEDIEDAELKTIATCAALKKPHKSSVDIWFHLLKSHTQSESWESIYSRLAEIRSMEFDWKAKVGMGKIRSIRQGITPLPFDQMLKLVVGFKTELHNNISTMVLLERAYKFSVLADNFRRDWNKTSATSQLLPTLDLHDALIFGYESVHKRHRGHHQRPWQ